MAETNSTQEKKGWLSGLKDWAFVPENETQAQPEKNNPVKRPAPSNYSGPMQMPTSSPIGTTIPTMGVAMLNPAKELKAMEHYMELLDKANLPGPDFFEFYNALRENIKAMGGAITDEKVIYTLVFNTLKGMGLQANVLISSGEQYVALLKEHYDKFTKENERIISESVGSRQKKIETLNVAIQQKLEQIKKLQEEIAAHNTDIGAVQSEIQNETKNIEETRLAMESAYNKIHTEFSNVGAKCKAYIPQQ